MAEKLENGSIYSIEYILTQIARIQEQTEYLNTALEKLASMGDGDSGGPGSPGNIQGEAKAQAIGDVVRCRETTNQQMLSLYERMYNDLKPVDVRKYDVLKQLSEIVANPDEFAESKSCMLDTVRQIMKENFKD